MVLFYDVDWYIDFRDLVLPSPLAIVVVDALVVFNAPADNEVIPDATTDAHA